MARDGPGRGNGARARLCGGRHGGRAAGGHDESARAGRKPAKGHQTGVPSQQAPVYGAVPPPPSLHSNGVPSAGAGPSNSDQRHPAHPRASAAHTADPRLRSALARSASPAAARHAGLGSSRDCSNGGHSRPHQATAQACTTSAFVRGSSSSGGIAAVNGANRAGCCAAGVFGQGACRMAYEADKEPGIWKVPRWLMRRRA